MPITYADTTIPTFSFRPTTVRHALAILERHGVRPAAERTPIPTAILQGWQKALQGEPPARRKSAPISERERSVRSAAWRGRDITYSQPKAQQKR